MTKEDKKLKIESLRKQASTLKKEIDCYTNSVKACT